MNHFQSGAIMNEVAENVLVCVISYVGPFVFGKYKGREGSPGWRVAACSALVDQAVFQSASSSFPSHQQCKKIRGDFKLSKSYLGTPLPPNSLSLPDALRVKPTLFTVAHKDLHDPTPLLPPPSPSPLALVHVVQPFRLLCCLQNVKLMSTLSFWPCSSPARNTLPPDPLTDSSLHCLCLSCAPGLSSNVTSSERSSLNPWLLTWPLLWSVLLSF